MMQTRRRERAAVDTDIVRDLEEVLNGAEWSTQHGGCRTGDMVRVLCYPEPALDPSEATATVPVTVAPLQGHPRELQGLVVSLIDAKGRPLSATLDANAHVVFTAVPLGTYRLQVASSDSRSPRRAVARPQRRRGPGSGSRARSRGPRLGATLLAVVSILSAGLLFAGPVNAVCRGDQEIPGPAEPRPGPLTGHRVLVAAVWEDKEQAQFTKVLQRFEERTGAEVQYDAIGHNIAGVIASRIKAGCAPDVVLLPQPGMLADLAERQFITPVEDVVGALVDENYAPAWRTFATVGDSLYGVWYKAANKSLIWYDGPLFDRLGLEPPQTWAELKRVAATIAAAEPDTAPFALGGADGWVWTDLFENIYLQTAEADRYDQLADHRLPWTDESVKHALRLLVDVFGRPGWVAGGIEGALQTSFKGSVDQVFGDKPQAAMVYEGSFVADFLREPAMLGDRARSFSFPMIHDSEPSVVAGGDSSAAGATGGDVAALVTRSPAGAALLRFLATPEAAEPWVASGGFISPNKNVPLTAYPAEVRPSVARLIAGSNLRYDLSDLQPPDFGSVDDRGMWKILQDLVATSDVDAAADRLEVARSVAREHGLSTSAQTPWRALLIASLVVALGGLLLVGCTLAVRCRTVNAGSRGVSRDEEHWRSGSPVSDRT